MLRGRPLLGIGLAALLITGAYFGVRASDDWRQQQVADEALRSAREAAIRAREIVSVQNEAVALMGSNAVVNSRLIVAIRGRVDSETLADVFAGEAWWEPYRNLLTAISYQGTEIAFSQGADVRIVAPGRRSVAAVRADNGQISRFVTAAGRAYVMAATPMRFGAGLEDAVLVLARPFDQARAGGRSPPGPTRPCC